MAHLRRDQLKVGVTINLQNVMGGSVIDHDVSQYQIPVRGWQTQNSPAQAWVLTRPPGTNDPALFAFQSSQNGQFLTPGGPTNGAPCTVTSNPYAWRLLPGSNGDSYKFEPTGLPSRMLCLYFGNGANGVKICTWVWARGWDTRMSWYLRVPQGYEYTLGGNQHASGPQQSTQAVQPCNHGPEIDELKRQLAEALNGEEAARGAAEEAKSQREGTDRELNEYKKRYEETKEQVRVSEQRVNNATQKTAAFEREAANAKARADALMKEKQAADKRADDFAKELAQLKETNESHMHSCGPKQQSLEREIERLKQELQKISSSNQGLQQEVERLKQELQNRSNSNHDDLRQEIERLKQEVQKRDSSNQGLRQEVARLKQELQNTDSSKQGELQREIDRLRQELQKKDSPDQQRLQREIERLKREVQKRGSSKEEELQLEIERLKELQGKDPGRPSSASGSTRDDNAATTDQTAADAALAKREASVKAREDAVSDRERELGQNEPSPIHTGPQQGAHNHSGPRADGGKDVPLKAGRYQQDYNPGCSFGGDHLFCWSAHPGQQFSFLPRLRAPKKRAVKG